MKKQYFTFIICALLFCSTSVLAQIGNTMQNPIFAGNFSRDFVCPDTKNTDNFTDNYTYPNKRIQTNDVFYRFTLTKAMEVTISHCGSALVSTCLHLLDVFGNRIAYSNGVNTSISGCTSSRNAYLKMTLPAGTYYVVSEGYSTNGEIKTVMSGVVSDFDYTVFPDTKSSSSQAVGGIAGAFDVSPTGAATYSIPIEVPLGANGLQPNIAITYNSQAGNGVAGFGTNISGISVITRVPKSIYYDGTASGINYGSSNDAFMLDGQRLIADPNSANTYYPESDPFTKIVRNSNVFTVQTKDGLTYIYSPDKVRIKYITNYYHLTETKDLFGNYIKYVYNNSNDMNEHRYLASIEYGNSSAVQNTITFAYENRQDTVEYKFINTPIAMSKRLKTITTKTSDNVFRKYTLGYNFSVVGHFSRLASVIVENGAGEALNHTSLEWNPLQEFSQTVNTPPGAPSTNRLLYMSGDMDGDGLDDLIEVYTIDDTHNYARIYNSVINTSGNIEFQSGNAVYLGSNMWIYWKNVLYSDKGRLIADFDGDGINEILSVYGDNQVLKFRSDISSKANNDWDERTATHFHMPNYDAIFTTGDFDNDGRTDIAIKDTKTKQLKIVKYDPSIQDFEVNGTSYTINSLSSRPCEIFAADFNGNGMTDIMLVCQFDYTILWNQGNGVFSDDSKTSGSAIFGNDYNMLRMGDFNGDGLPDFLMNKKGDRGWFFALNNGDGTFSAVLAYNNMTSHNIGFTEKDDGQFTCMVYDFDLDGKSDVVYTKAIYDNVGGGKYKQTDTYWLRSTGTKLELERTVTSTEGADDASAKYFVLGDFNGDGKQELMNYGYDCYDGGGSRQWRIYQTPSIASSNKLTYVTDGFGNRTDIIYDYLTTKNSVYTKGDSSAYPLIDIQPALSVVKNVTASNGVAGSMTTYYTYEGARVHLRGKGFMGFKKMTANNITMGVKTETGVTSLNYTFYTPSETYTKTTTTNNQTAQTTVNYTYVDKLNKKYFAYPNKKIETDIYGNIVTTDYLYESTNGNITQEKTTFGSNTNYRQIDYANYFQAGGTRPNKPQLITITQKHSNDKYPITNKTYFTYDAAKGYLTKKIENYQQTGFELTTDYESYDSIGNLTSYKISGAGINPITYNIEYDATERFVAKTTTSPSTTIMTYTYDIWGNVLTEKDQTNSTTGLTTTHKYNNWGQRTATTLPTGQKITITRGWGSSDNNNQKYFTVTQGTGMPWVKTWYDAAGRVTKTESIGAKDMAISETNTYNSKGQLTQTISKQGDLILTDKYEYDAFGRLTKETKNSGQVINYAYESKEVTTTTNGRTYTKTFDAWGNVRTAADPGGRVIYTYDSHGNPMTITAAGATTSMTYNIIGQQTSLTDPNAGTTTYEYNLLGQLRKQTDARGNITENFYDNRNRLAYSTLNGVRTDYIYGTSGNNNLRLTEIKQGNNSIKYTYDSYGDISTEERIMDNVSIYYVQYQRDSQTKKTTPYFYNPDKNAANGAGNFYNKSTFDAYGNLVKKEATIHTPSSQQPTAATIWELTANTGTQTTANIANAGMTLTKGYDSKGFLNNQTTKKGSTNILNLNYYFTPTTGNLSSRSGMMPNPNNSEYFDYDNLDRLISHYAAHQGTHGISYDTKGNILTKTNLGSDRYAYNNFHKPHAIREIENTNNFISTTEQIITYNAFNKVSKITEGQYELEIFYGPDQQRWKTELKKNEIIEKITIFAPDYERVTTYANGTVDKIKHFYYIYSGDGLSAIGVNENGQSTKIYYAHTDHLGSIVKLTEANGNEVFNATYDAWGEQSVWQNTIGFHRGYTGHEHLMEFGLINMNGRMYDPLLGRMLSPDNYVQDPFFSQSYNRYAYCFNNPLSYIDPSGELAWFVPVIIGAVVGAYTGASIQSGTAAFWNWSSDAWKGAIVGGIIGAAGGALVSAAIGPAGGITGMTGVGGKSTLGWSMTSSALKTASINMGVTTIFTDNIDAIWKSGVTGLISGGLSGGLDFAFSSNNFGFWEGAGVGALTGATANTIDGYLNGKRNEDLLLHIGKGALLTGVSNGLVSGFSARLEGRNFWNGENYVYRNGCKVGYYKPIRPISLENVHSQMGLGLTSDGKGLYMSFGFDFGKTKWWQNSYYIRNSLTNEPVHLVKGSNWRFPLFFKILKVSGL